MYIFRPVFSLKIQVSLPPVLFQLIVSYMKTALPPYLTGKHQVTTQQCLVFIEYFIVVCSYTSFNFLQQKLGDKQDRSHYGYL